MSQTQRRRVQLLFILAALYDGLLGLGFLLAAPQFFEMMGLAPANHWGYIQFAASLLVVFAIMFTAIVLKPKQNRNLIPYGILLKVSYIGVVLGYWITSSLVGPWKIFAGLDAVFLVLFVWAYGVLGSTSSTMDVVE